MEVRTNENVATIFLALLWSYSPNRQRLHEKREDPKSETIKPAISCYSDLQDCFGLFVVLSLISS